MPGEVRPGDHKDLVNALAARGVTDPITIAADLAAARVELAPRFTISDTADPSRDAPNTITPAEFEQVAQTYSAIRLGNSDLRIAPPTADDIDPKETASFQGRAMDDLAAILQTRSGRQLIGSLANQPAHHKTVLMDLGDGTASMASPNASGLEADDNETGVNLRNNVGVAAATVHYRPDRYGPNRSDDLLFHELVHAQGEVTGTQAPETAVNAADGALPGDAGVSQEEYRTVGLGRFASGAITENVYRAERRAIGASGAGALVGDADLPDRKNYLDVLASQSPTLAAKFQTVQGPEPEKGTREWFAWQARGTSDFSSGLEANAKTADAIAKALPDEAAGELAEAAGDRDAAAQKAALENADDLIPVKPQ